MNLSKISKTLLILATASLIFRKGVFLQTFTPKPFEFFLILALISGFFYFFPKNLNKFKNIDKKIYLALFIFLFSVGLATLISYLRYGVGFNAEGILNAIRFLIMIITFILFYVFLKEDEIFYKRVWRSFCVSVIFIPFLIFPELAYKLSLVKEDGRFYGFLQHPSTASLFFLVALSFFFVLFLKNFYQKRGCFCLVYFLLTATMASLVLWSQTRAAWLGMISVLIAANYLSIIPLRKKLLGYFLLNTAIIILILILAFTILPSSAKTTLILRIYPQYRQNILEKTDDPRQFSSENLRELIFKIKTGNIFPNLGFEQWRPVIWKGYLNLIPKNPFGLGVNYLPQLAVTVNKEAQGFHNLLLEFWAYGGIGSLGAFLYILWRTVLNIKNKIKSNSQNLSSVYIYNICVVSTLAGLIIYSLFDVLIFQNFFWILLAMALI
jgi:hypothetical protein